MGENKNSNCVVKSISQEKVSIDSERESIEKCPSLWPTLWYRLPLGTEQVVSSIPDSV